MGAEVIHVLLVSFVSQGHVNPFLRLAKRIASKGLHVTFSTTTDVGNRLVSAVNTTIASAAEFSPIGKGHLRFEFFSDGWEDNDPRKVDLDLYMPQLARVGSVAVADLIRRQASEARPVSCVINNPFVPWVLDVAVGMGIPCGVLWVQSCAVFSTYYHYFHRLTDFPSKGKPDLSVKLAGVPTMRPSDIPSFLLPSNTYPALTTAILAQFENLSKASFVLVNSFDELERDVIEALSPWVPLVPVGPLVELSEEKSKGSNKLKGDLVEATSECMEWLDSKPPASVVYVSIGSIVVMTKEEMEELALGLKNSYKNFLWVVRHDQRQLLPEGFEKDTEGRGLVVKWSPQDRVLSHHSVGCFLTHCGWNSTLECLAAGVPVITFPHWGDQTTDAMFLADVWGVGVHLRTGGNERGGGVDREEVVKAVEEVMEGDKAKEMRGNALKLKAAARKAIAADGSSDRNLQMIVDEIRCGPSMMVAR